MLHWWHCDFLHNTEPVYVSCDSHWTCFWFAAQRQVRLEERSVQWLRNWRRHWISWYVSWLQIEARVFIFTNLIFVFIFIFCSWAEGGGAGMRRLCCILCCHWILFAVTLLKNEFNRQIPDGYTCGPALWLCGRPLWQQNWGVLVELTGTCWCSVEPSEPKNLSASHNSFFPTQPWSNLTSYVGKWCSKRGFASVFKV